MSELSAIDSVVARLLMAMAMNVTFIGDPFLIRCGEVYRFHYCASLRMCVLLFEVRASAFEIFKGRAMVVLCVSCRIGSA